MPIRLLAFIRAVKAFSLSLILISMPFIASAQSDAPELNLSYASFTLDNGLKVIVHEDHKAPIVAVSVWYHVGSKNEPAGQTGFAHLFEHLMFNGSENYDDEWFEPMQQVGATGMNGTTWLDRTNYFQTVPTPALDLALWMESDRMGHLLGAVTQEKLDNQRGVVQNEKRQGDNQPYGRVNYNLYEGLFPEDHPYHHSTIGSMDDLNAASLEDVQQWFKDYYGPNNAILSLAGDIDLATAKEKVERFFGDISPGPEVDSHEVWVPQRSINTSESQYDEVPSILANRAWAVPPRDTRERALLDIAAAIIGNGRNSRLYMDLMYNRQLASSVYVGVTPFELASVFDLSIELNAGEPASVASESIDRIIAEFLEDGPTSNELRRVVTGINAETIRGLEEVGGFTGKAAQLAEGEIYAGDPLFINQYLQWVNNATAREVRDVARAWLSQGWHQVNVVPTGQYTENTVGVDRTGGLPAIPDNLPKLSFPDIQRATLSNGIEVILAERHSVPVVSLSIQFDAGYATDAGNKLGVASFAMDMLDTGTRRRSSLEISDEEERLGAIINVGSHVDDSFINLSALNAELEDSIDLWADIIINPAFDETELQRLKGQRIADIAQEKAEPETLAARLMPPLLFGPNHAYGIPFSGNGTVASAESITRQDLVNFQNTWLRPDNAQIFVVGNTTLAQMVPLLEDALRRWRTPGPPAGSKNLANALHAQSPRLIMIDKPGSPQSYIMAGQLIPGLGSDIDLAYGAMNDVLGGSFTSRINMNLREDKGWSYGSRTSSYGAQGQRPFLVLAPVQTDRTAEALVELMNELNGIRTSSPISQQEMDKVIAGSTRELPGRFETSQAVLNSLVNSARYGRQLNYAATLTDAYERLELTDLQNAANDLLRPDNLIWIIIGDLALIEKQVDALGIAEMEIMDDDGRTLVE